MTTLSTEYRAEVARKATRTNAENLAIFTALQDRAQQAFAATGNPTAAAVLSEARGWVEWFYNHVQREQDAAATVYDSQDLAAVLEHVSPAQLAAAGIDADEVTAARVQVGEGEYTAVWLTASAWPFAANAPYHRVI